MAGRLALLELLYVLVEGEVRLMLEASEVDERVRLRLT